MDRLSRADLTEPRLCSIEEFSNAHGQRYVVRGAVC